MIAKMKEEGFPHCLDGTRNLRVITVYLYTDSATEFEDEEFLKYLKDGELKINRGESCLN